MGNSVSLKFRGAQIWNKLPNVFKIIKHCTPFKKCVAYEVFAYGISQIRNTTRREKNTGQCFSIELQFTYKNSDNSEQNKKRPKIRHRLAMSAKLINMFDWVRLLNERCSIGFDNRTFDISETKLHSYCRLQVAI